MKHKMFKRSISLFMVVVFFVLCSVPVNGSEVTDNKMSVGLKYFFKEGYDLPLVERKFTSHMSYVEDMRNSVVNSLALEVLSLFAETGSEPDKTKYMEVLVSIMKTYELENATSVSEQHKMDNLKAIEDYAMDALDIGISLLPGLKGADSETQQLGEWIKIAINGLNTVADNTTNWIEGISDLETLIDNYRKHDVFLGFIASHSSGDLKSAAITLQKSMNEAMKIKIDTYSDIMDDNFSKYTEFFFDDMFFETLKLTEEYENDEGIQCLVKFGSNGFKLWTALKLGIEIGKFIGNIAIGYEDIVNRNLEMKAVYDISSILEEELRNLKNSFTDNYSNKTDSIAESYVIYSNYLISSRIRGEYCMYSMLAEDSGLYSHIKKEVGVKAEQLYNRLTDNLYDIKDKLEELDDILIVNVGSELPYEAVNTNSEWYVYGSDGLLYDNYILRVYDKESLINYVRKGPVDEADSTVTEYIVKKAEPLKISLEKGYVYTFEFIDGDDAEKSKLMKVGVTNDDKKLIHQVEIETEFGGDIYLLSYEMRQEKIEFHTSDGALFYENNIEYPYFHGNSLVATKLNQRYQKIIDDHKTYDGDIDREYKEYLEWNSQKMLPFYDDVSVDVTYNTNGYISLYEVYSMWSGGMHPYNYENGITYRLEDGTECIYTDILTGNDAQRTQLARYYIEKEMGDSVEYLLKDFYDSPYTLMEEGVCFYLWMGDAVAPLEIIIPYTNKENCIVNIEESLQQIGYTENQIQNNTELVEYLGKDIQETVDLFENMSQMPTDSNIFFTNEVLTMCSDTMSSGINQISINKMCEYTIAGVAYGMDLKDAQSIILSNGFVLEYDGSEYDFMRYASVNGTQIQISYNGFDEVNSITIYK